METLLKETPLIDEHKNLGAKIAPFGGWAMPIQYEGIIAEHNWTRNSVSLFDICHMGEFMLYGTAKDTGLDKIVTQRLYDMADGSCRYGFALGESAGIVDDLIVYKIADDKWMIVVNAATIEKDEKHFRKYLSRSARLDNISDKTGKLDLQGPLSRDVLRNIFGKAIDSLDYYHFSKFNILGEENIISRTGYTGELGYELYISAQKTEELWKLLLKDARVKPAGLGARDTLRLEMCYPLYGQDIDDNISPVEAGLERFVDYEKDFIGKKELLRKKANPGKKMIAFTTNSRRSPRHNYSINIDGKDSGFVTSGSFSPSLSCGIGMGYVETAHAVIGENINIKSAQGELQAMIVKKPFYKKGSATK